LDEGSYRLVVQALERGNLRDISRLGRKADVSTTIPRYDLLDLGAYLDVSAVFARLSVPMQFCDIIVLYGRKPRTAARKCWLSCRLSMIWAGGAPCLWWMTTSSATSVMSAPAA